MPMPNTKRLDALTWVRVLNEHSEWKSENDANKWLANLSRKNDADASAAACEKFCHTLSQIRHCIYKTHFGSQAEFSWLSAQLKQLRLVFDNSPEAVRSGLPPLRGACTSIKNDDDLLESISSAILIQFANHLSASLAAGSEICGRCEGLYRDPNAVQLSMVPGIDDQLELPWRKEIDLLVEESLESEMEIQRCADLFPSDSRSKYCSDKCRFSTFQIVKQYKDPDYLAEKQRRYRAKKSEI